MNKQQRTTALLLIGTFLLLLLATFFLPDEIPFHFDANGEARMVRKQIFYPLAHPRPLPDLSSVLPQNKIITIQKKAPRSSPHQDLAC